MSRTLYYHPFASFCQKVMIALYELDVPFEPLLVDLGDPVARAEFAKVWPFAKFPVLRDGDTVIPESTLILEHLNRHYGRLIPEGDALKCRLLDRVFDSYVQEPMQKVVLDRLRPEGERDSFGVEQARQQLVASYAYLDTQIVGPWALGDSFSMADCAAAPALFYAEHVVPLTPTLRAYLERLKQRPSYARVLDEARPYFKNFPLGGLE